ncbi:MAG: glucose 1-dehydrogenase [Planctomycetaceae bacterium]
MSQKLSGKVAVVTGASKGIGAAIALQLAADGASVVVNYASSRSGADRVVSEIVGNGGKAVAVQADLSNQSDVQKLFAETKKQFGHVDILVNNAGIYEFGALEEITAEHFHRQFNLNVLGLLFATQEAVKLIGPEGGSVINVSSVVSTAALPGTAVYSATKGAVDVVTQALAKELGPRKIRVNAVNPGMVETEGTHSAGITDSDFRKQTEMQTPLGRIGQPRDIAPYVAFLASDDASWITGQMLNISGGFR